MGPFPNLLLLKIKKSTQLCKLNLFGPMDAWNEANHIKLALEEIYNSQETSNVLSLHSVTGCPTFA